MDIIEYVDFTGEEKEKEFLEKCYKQWEIACEANATNTQKNDYSWKYI